MAAETEFSIIERYFAPLAHPRGSLKVEQGPGDDCGVVTLTKGASLCFSIDTMVEGIHFPEDAAPGKIAYRALAAAMSDLAAMGATPLFFTVALTLPKADPEWLAGFSAGLKILVEKYRFPLLGGDTTKGPLTISIQVHGELMQRGLLRSGAQPNDIIAVSGTLGDAGAALSVLESSSDAQYELDESERYLLGRYYFPTPRIELGRSLLGCASACIDISDGLLSEAGHIAEASSVGLYIDSYALPLSAHLKAFKGESMARKLALSSGDDYELLFTVPPEKWNELLSRCSDINISPIGRVKPGSGVYLDNADARVFQRGFQHFA